MAEAEAVHHRQHHQHLKTPISKRLWPFKKSPKPVCRGNSTTPSPCPSPSTLDLHSPAQSEKTLLWLSLTPKPAATPATTAVDHPASASPSVESVSNRPVVPPKDDVWSARWKEQRQARRRGVLQPSFSHLVDQRSPHHPPLSTPRSTRSSGSPVSHEKAEWGLERIASMLRWNKSAPLRVHETADDRPIDDEESQSDQESLVVASEIPLRSFAASRSSISSSKAPPPIFIPRPKITLTAANGPSPLEGGPRPASTEPTYPPLVEYRPRLSAPAIITPSSYVSKESPTCSSNPKPLTRSSTVTSSVAHAEIGAAQRLSVAPARVISNLIAAAGEVGDEIRTAMETPLTGFSMPPSDHIGSPSDEGFPAGPLSAKSAVYLAGSARRGDMPHFDLDVLLHSPSTTENPSKGSCELDEAPVEPPYISRNQEYDNTSRDRKSYDTLSSVKSASTVQSRHSTAATSMTSSSSQSVFGTFQNPFLRRSNVPQAVAPSDVEELAEPSVEVDLALPEAPPTPQLPWSGSKASELSSRELDTELKKFILESMHVLVREDPQLLSRDAMVDVDKQLQRLSDHIFHLKGEQQHLAKAQTALFARSAKDLSPEMRTELAKTHHDFILTCHELVKSIQHREKLKMARVEHLAASATLSLGRLNSSFISNKQRLAKAEHKIEDMQLQRSAADLRMSQLQSRLKAREAEVRRLKTVNRQLQTQDVDGWSSKRPSNEEIIEEIPADPAVCLSSELDRVLEDRGKSPLPSPSTTGMGNPSPLSPSLSSFTFDQLPSRTSSLNHYVFPPLASDQDYQAKLSEPRQDAYSSQLQHHRTPYLGLTRRVPPSSTTSSLGHGRIGLRALGDMLDRSSH